MIVTTLKPLDELMDFISHYKSILIIGCDGCTQPPRGIKETETLSQLLELASKQKNKKFNFRKITMAKQCDSNLVTTVLGPQIEGVDAILSLACGIGVQEIARLFPRVLVFPAQNTHFMGAEEREVGFFEEMCAGCGDCLLAMTGSICPVARCTKGLVNGACGGSKNGKCELSPERDCAWVLIYKQLKKQGKLQNLREFRPPRNYQQKGWRIVS